MKRRAARPVAVVTTLVLAVVLVLDGVPVAAFAEDASDEIEVVEDVELVEQGDDPVQTPDPAETPDSDETRTFTTGGIAEEPVKSVHDANEDDLVAQDTLPAAYDSRAYGYATGVRDQSLFGTCWAFGATAAIEASLLRRNQDLVSGYDSLSLDLSERQIAYFTFNRPADPLHNTDGDSVVVTSDDFDDPPYMNVPSYLSSGGSALYVIHTLATWTGMALEVSASYADLLNTYRSYKKSSIPYTSFLANTALGQELARGSNIAQMGSAYMVKTSDTEDLKRLVMDYGAACVNMYVENSCGTRRSGSSGSANDAYVYYYCDKTEYTNHMMTIVGWDDNVSRDLFGDVKPSSDGAWLCKNSWGTASPYGGGYSGYYWISYEDAPLRYRSTGYVFDMEPVGAQDNLYMYDGSSMTNCNYVQSGGSIANVFEAKANDDGEMLTDVSVFLQNANTDYSVQVYTDPTDSRNPTSGTPQLAKPLAGKARYAGLHKLVLPQEVPLVPGQKFAVVVTLSHRDGTPVGYGVGATYTNSVFSCTESVTEGQSFEKEHPGGSWEDLATKSGDDNGQLGYDETYCTASVKAYTSNVNLRDSMNVASARVSPIPDQPFFGGEVCPKLTVTYRGHVLRENVDYYLYYSENEAVGRASVLIQGVGFYTGWNSASFNIVKPSVQDATLSGIANQTYNGGPHTPKPIVTWRGKRLVEGTDYTLSYANNVNVGTATVTVVGRGYYEGSKSVTFAIVGATPTPAPAPAPQLPTPHVSYRTHVQKKGWQRYVTDGAMSGTSGKGLRLEGINIRLSDLPYAGGIRYRTHVQRIGWQGWRKDGRMSGTKGKALRLEAIRIELYGELAEHYDVYYRVHAQRFGWMGWARDGEQSGTAGYGRRLEGIQVVLVRKGDPAPGRTLAGITQRISAPFRQKGKR